jgi:hypothetical protein
LPAARVLGISSLVAKSPGDHMRTQVCVALLVLVPVLASSAWGQADSLPARADSLTARAAESHAHVVHVADAFEGAPGGYGLLRIAVAEAEIAALHADLAAQAVNSVDDVRLHVGHMRHALDPAVTFTGPGLGYGLRRAVDEALFHLNLAATSIGASDNVRTHAMHIASVLGNTYRRAEAMLTLAAEIELATPSGVVPLLGRLNEASNALGPGFDADRDGLIGWQAGEGGLRQAVWHMTLLKRGEGLLTLP